MKERTHGGKEPISGESGGRHWADTVTDGTPDGIRHDTAVRFVGRWHGKDLVEKGLGFTLEVWQGINSPPLTYDELKMMLRSTIKLARPRNPSRMTDAKADQIAVEVKEQTRKKR